MVSLNEALQSNRASFQQFKRLTRVTVNVKLFSRSCYADYVPINIITSSPEQITIHDGRRRENIARDQLNVCLENEVSNIASLVAHLMREQCKDEKPNDRKLSINFYIASEQKLDQCKYSFMIREIVAKEAAKIRKGEAI